MTKAEKTGEFRLEDFLPYKLAVAAARVSRDFSAHYCDEFGITIPEWRVLANLSMAGKVSVRDIHERVAMDKSKVSRAADRLLDAGLITKSVNTGDRRLVSLALTAKGHALLTKITPRAEAFNAELMQLIGTDADELATALDRLAKAPGRK